MRRRDLLLAFAAIGALPLPAHAQRSNKVRSVGYLFGSTTADFPVLHDALRRGLADLGYVDGKNVEIVLRSADGMADRYPALVGELVQRKVDVIFATNTSAAVAAKAGAPTTPIVFAGVGDPLGLGLVKSLARPGGNATGIALLTPELTPKRLALLKEAVPGVTRVAVLWNAGTKGHDQQLDELEEMSRSLRVAMQRVSVQRPEEFEPAFATMSRERAEGLVVLSSPLHHRNLHKIAELALKHRLPAICEFSEFTGVGGLLVYGPSWADMYRRAATYVAKIFEGSKPADLPVEQPATIELLVNLKTANALGLAVPQSILLRADKRIE